MQTYLNQQPTKVHQSQSVELKTFNARPTHGRKSFDDRSGLGPLKVILPTLGAGVEKWDHGTGHRIGGDGFGPFRLLQPWHDNARLPS